MQFLQILCTFSCMHLVTLGFGAIEAMTRDQSASVQQVGAVQHQLDGITQENASAVNEAAEQVRLLDRIVEEIGGRIGEFQADARVDEVPLSSAA